MYNLLYISLLLPDAARDLLFLYMCPHTAYDIYIYIYIYIYISPLLPDASRDAENTK
jgi:hypothetical protein